MRAPPIHRAAHAGESCVRGIVMPRKRQTGDTPMPRGSKDAYTNKQKRQAEHIEDSYKDRGTSDDEAERRAWATVNKQTGGGRKSGSGRKGSAKKSGGRKSSAKKSGARKSSAKKSSGRRSSAKKSSGRKSSAKKSSGRKSAKTSGGRKRAAKKSGN
jgi:plasmid stabilization system protein ParE